MANMPDILKNQIEITDKSEILKAIGNAKNINDMNKLRMSCVKINDTEVLKSWQKKYWDLKQCPTCGKSY